MEAKRQHFSNQRLGEAILAGAANRIEDALEEVHIEDAISILRKVVARMISNMNKEQRTEFANDVAKFHGEW